MDSKHNSYGDANNLWNNFLDCQLASLGKSNLYRQLRIVSNQGATAIVNGKRVLHLCSNDYLGLSENAQVRRQAAKSLSSLHISECSSRLVAGNHPKIVELESRLACHRGTEDSLVYPTGYTANLGVISAIADKESVIYSDELNHASIIDACRLSGANVRIFAHNNVDILRQLLDESPRSQKKIVITEGIFSMDGDVAPLKQLCKVARERGALVVVDDAHGDFVFGAKDGRLLFSGTPASLCVNDLVDIHISSMSKGLGCFGGYVATSTKIRDLLVNKSRPFIYTSALPEHLCAAALVALKMAKKGSLQDKLFRNIQMISSKLRELGFYVGAPCSQIIPVIIGDEKLAMKFSEQLLKEGVFAQAIRYPTVKLGAARLRITITAMHTTDQIEYAIGAFEEAGKRCGLLGCRVR